MNQMLATVLLSGILLNVSCDKNTHFNEQNNQINPITISADASNSLTDFSFDFFKTLQTDKNIPSSKNIFVSPLSLHMALAMLVNGAEGNTKNQLLKGMNIEEEGLNELNSLHKKLLDELPEADKKVVLALANSIWYRNSFSVKNDFLVDVKNFYNAKITPMAFVPSDVDIINQWASDNTNGKIKKVIDNIDDDAVMFLMNALYFKGDWRNKFDQKNTVNEAFTNEDGTKKTVKMMNMTDTLSYAVMDKFRVAQKPYGNSQFTATFILPNDEENITDIFANMTRNKWKEVLAKTHINEVRFSLPKFTFTGDYVLNNTLMKMGITDIFSANADFYKLSNTHTQVSFVKQDVYLGVDEIGTEAAAVTTIGMITTSMPQIIDFKCNKPFGIVISERTSGIVLFMGKITNP